jgi:hypothetical protein
VLKQIHYSFFVNVVLEIIAGASSIRRGSKSSQSKVLLYRAICFRPLLLEKTSFHIAKKLTGWEIVNSRVQQLRSPELEVKIWRE